MNQNEKTIKAHLDNLTSEGKRERTWKVISELYGVSKDDLLKISTIKKRTTDKEFELFISCMTKEKTILFNNGTSTYSIQHIATLLRKGYKIVSEGKHPTSSCSRKERSSLYLLESAGYYKIGVTLDSSIDRRILQLQTGNPNIITLICKTGTISNAYELEALLHKKYKNNNVRGEWITLSAEELASVTEYFEKHKNNTGS